MHKLEFGSESLTDQVLKIRNERIIRTSTRERKQRKKRQQELNAKKNNHLMTLRQPVMPLEEPEENAPFLWMTLTDSEKKKAIGKYFSLQELERRAKGREDRQKKRGKKAKQMPAKKKARQKEKKMQKKSRRASPGKNNNSFLRPITPMAMPPTSPLLLSVEEHDEQVAMEKAKKAGQLIEGGGRPTTSGTVQSDAVFNEFKALVEHAEQSNTFLRFEAFKKQFRGSNPYIKTTATPKEEKGPAEEDGDTPERSWRRPFDPLQPTCRKCGLDVNFAKKQCLASCAMCGNLINLMEWKAAKKHQYKKQKEKLNRGKYSKGPSNSCLRPTYGQIVKQRLNAKVKERFATEMGDVCNFLSRRQHAGKPLGENIWKKFDLVQARLRNNLR